MIMNKCHSKSIPDLKDWNNRPRGFFDEVFHPGCWTHLQRLQPRPLQCIGQDVSHLIFHCHHSQLIIGFHHLHLVSRTCSLVRDVSRTSAHSSQLIRATSLIGFTPNHGWSYSGCTQIGTTTLRVEEYHT